MSARGVYRRGVRRPVARLAAVLAAMCLSASLLAACGSSAPAPGSAADTAPAGTATRGSGPVDVLYAGSLVGLMQHQIGPGFRSATGYHVVGFPGGSNGLAAQIRGKVRAADVFISANPGVNASLTGAHNGGWVSWYARFASSALVLGYNPNSGFAAKLRTEPWYRVITEPGFRLGTTDPSVDPKGKLAEQALTETADARHLPALAKLATDAATYFPEQTLVGRLQAGQLDAGFFYDSEAVAAKIPTVPLAGVDLRAGYTVTILNHARHPGAAAAFVAYLLGPHGRAALRTDGYTVVNPPRVSGSGVPSGLKSLFTGP